MKKRRRILLVLFVLLTAANTAVYFFRDRFSFHKNGNHDSLYGSNPIQWKQFVYDFPRGELGSAKKLIDNKLSITKNSSVEKVLAIGHMLYISLHQQFGTPSAVLNNKSPLRQYEIISSSDSVGFWCGHYGNMFAFFCWSEGIPCRVIEIMNPGDHHVLNECYLEEIGQWALVDLTYNRLLIKNLSSGGYLNFEDILHSTHDKAVSIQATKDSFAVVSFNPSSYRYYLKSNPLVNYYYRTDISSVYKPREKVKRYLLPVTWYQEVNGSKNNFAFFVKELLIVLWLVSFLVLVRQTLKSSFAKSSNTAN